MYRDHDHILSNKFDNHNDNYHINNYYYGDNIIVYFADIIIIKTIVLVIMMTILLYCNNDVDINDDKQNVLA